MKIWNLAYSITNKCNLRCSHCYASSGMPYEDELSTWEISHRILDEAQITKTKFITLTGGEPFTRKDLFSVMEEIKKRDIKVCVATNGMLLSKDKISTLKTLGIDRIQISLEGPDAMKNDRIRGEGVFEKITNQVIPELKNQGLFVAVSMTPTSLNFQEVRRMAELCCKLNIDSFSVRRFAFEGRGKAKGLEYGLEENKELLQEICHLRKTYDGKLKISTGDPLYILVDENKDQWLDKKLLGGCTAGIVSLAIDAHGNVKPCTRADLNLGNVRIDSMAEIWERNEILQKIRNRNSYEGKCGSCKYKMLCGGCRVAALRYEKSILGADPKCWL